MKNNFRTIAPILCLFILITSFTGCGESPYKDTGEKTRVVTDCIGRKVKIPENPQKVVCLYAATAHMLTLIDEGDKIVGAPDGVRRDVVMRMKYPNIKNISVPFQSGSINIEELLKINADLALIRKSTGENKSETEKLKKLNIPYVVVDFSNIKELKKAIRLIGEIFDKTDVTDDYIDYIDDTLKYVDKRLTGLNDTEKVTIYHSVNEATRTYASDCISAEITNLAGAENMSLNMNLSVGDDGGYTSLEEIYKYDPQVIFTNDYNVSKYIKDNAKWQGLTAVKNNKIIALPVGVSRWGHFGSIEPQMGVLFMAATLYPERFEDTDLTQTVVDYYKKFFKLNITKKLAQQILSGEGMRLEK